MRFQVGQGTEECEEIPLGIINHGMSFTQYIVKNINHGDLAKAAKAAPVVKYWATCRYQQIFKGQQS